MGLNLSRGNMYPWVTHTWNPAKGRCGHECIYCYVPAVAKRYGRILKPVRLVESELKTNLYKYKDMKPPFTIFVGSTTDLFILPREWIESFLKVCNEYPDNTYLFQSKAPANFEDYLGMFPPNTILGTTIETNRNYNFSKAPKPGLRVSAIARYQKFRRMVSIEPIIDFDLQIMINWIKNIRPEFVSIGADSKKEYHKHDFPEPNKEKVEKLITELKKITEVRVKSNLLRMI